MRRKAPVRCGMGEKAEVILSPELYLSSFLSSQELGQFFGKDKTPREMKDTIMKLLEENKDKLKDISAPEKKTEQEK